MVDVLVYHSSSRSRNCDLTIPQISLHFSAKFCSYRVRKLLHPAYHVFFPPVPPTSSFRLPTLELEAADVGVRVDAKHLAHSFDQLSFSRGRTFFAAIAIAPQLVSLPKTMHTFPRNGFPW